MNSHFSENNEDRLNISISDIKSYKTVMFTQWKAIVRKDASLYNKDVNKRDKQKEETIMMKEIVKAIFEVLVNGQAVVKELKEL